MEMYMSLISISRRVVEHAGNVTNQIKGLALILSTVMLSASLQAAPTDDIDQKDPKAWVHLMQSQMNQVELNGYFTYERNSHSASYHYIRQIIDGKVRQRLIFMDGSEQGLLKSDGTLHCLHPNDKSFHEIRCDEIKSIFNVRQNFKDIWQYYDSKLLADNRVAGRDVKYIQLMPKKNDRFPYVFAIDADQGVLLKMVMTTPDGKVLEQFRYVSINFDDVSDATFNHGIEKYATSVLDVGQNDNITPSVEHDDATVKTPLAVSVIAEFLPDGFVEQTKQKPVEYSRSRTFSDGLSTFSVFIEALNSSVGDVDEKSPRIAMVSDGTAVSARYVDTKKGIFQLTVIGELPLDTVKKISDQLLVK